MRLFSFGGVMKVLMEAGEPPIEATEGGTTFYTSGGRALLRNRVTPVVVSTPAHQLEVAGVAAANVAWANLLTPAEQAAFYNTTFLGLNGYWLWITLWSVYHWIWNLLPPFVPPVGVAPDILIASVNYDPTLPLLELTISQIGGPNDARAYVAISGASSPGRYPDPSDCRTIATDVVPGDVLDLTSAYLLRYGAFAADGCQIRLMARAMSPSTLAFSELATAIVTSTASGGVTCSLTPDPLLHFGFASAPCVCEMSYPNPGMGAFWVVAILTPNFVWQVPDPTADIGVSANGNVYTNEPAGTYTVDFRFTSSEGPTCDISVSLIKT
jgi:hypothetical protein